MGQNKKPRVIDFFCWTWGFSEGFRQQWFKIVKWIDFWQTAIDTHNLNHGLNDWTKDVLEFRGDNDCDVKDIEELPEVEVLIGSPSCVSFSSSNKSWKAEKSWGIKLIESYLRVVAVKKYKPWSILRARYMENVPNSKKYVKEEYSFQDLNLWWWAKKIWLKENDIALRVKDNSAILNAWDFWSPQNRIRFIAWERIETWEFLHPKITHPKHISLGDVIGKLPKPNLKKSYINNKYVCDPNYNRVKIEMSKLTDHFYDTGVYKVEWENAKYFKTKHPYMGKMSFPENPDRTSRTILATRFPSARESILYKSEYDRIWDWEYRLPTIREIASLMWFPCTYQFCWSEGVKWRQIGNAVCPHMSNALAKELRKKLWLKEINHSEIDLDILSLKSDKLKNLNTFKKKSFVSAYKRRSLSTFKRHPFKSANMTVELMNHINNKKSINRNVCVFLWTWDWFQSIQITKERFLETKKNLKKEYKEFEKFYNKLNARFLKLWKISSSSLQEIFETDSALSNPINPINIVEWVADFVKNHLKEDKSISWVKFIPKTQIPLSQVLAIFSLSEFIFYHLE